MSLQLKLNPVLISTLLPTKLEGKKKSKVSQENKLQAQAMERAIERIRKF